jgi:hypothetical protein
VDSKPVFVLVEILALNIYQCGFLVAVMINGWKAKNCPSDLFAFTNWHKYAIALPSQLSVLITSVSSKPS